MGSRCLMNWIETIEQWRCLPPEEKLRRRWLAIHFDVAQSMAFKQEPVELRRLQEMLGQIERPASSEKPAASSPIPGYLRYWPHASCGRTGAGGLSNAPLISRSVVDCGSPLPLFEAPRAGILASAIRVVSGFTESLQTKV